MNIILKSKLNYLTKEIVTFIAIVVLGFILILASIFIKYKPVYEVLIEGKKLGNIQNESKFKKTIEEKFSTMYEQGVENVSLKVEPKYNIKLLKRTKSLNEQEILEKLVNEDTLITYKFYEVALNNETKATVKSMEEAEEIVNKIKEEFNGDNLELNLQINEKYTFNCEEKENIEVASNNVEEAAQTLKEEKERSEALAVINDVKISVLPVTGRISSRYGESSRLRRSTHTGLDIACTTGTDIKVASKGKVSFAEYNGAYGNLVKIDHGNGVETWYGHCSKIYTKVGTEVQAGDVIAAVGSTGNSTGPHLHFEIRINGETVNPQNYVY